jgi:hypothetical protein
MSEPEQPSQTKVRDQAKIQDTSLSDLLRVGSDPNAMLLGLTPPDGEGGSEESGKEESKADAAGTPKASGDAAADGAAITPDPAVEPSSAESDSSAGRRSGERRRPAAGKSAFAAWQIAGLMITALGLVLAALPLVVTPLPQVLERVLDPRVSSGILLVGGGLLFTFSVLRHTLQDLQSSLDAVSGETARLEEIAVDGHAVLKALHTVRLENTTLTGDVAKLQTRIKKLTEIVSNPDFAGSLFRLAASVDLLGKHVEVYMKQQFGTLDQRLTSIAQQSDHTEQQLKATLGQMHALMKEQLRVQQLAVQEGFDHLNSASDKTAGRIEQSLQTTARIEATIKNQQEKLSNGWVSLSERLALSVSQVSADLNDLRISIERQVQSQAESLHVEFEELDNRITLAERNQASGIQQLSEQVQGQFAKGIEDLDNRISLSERNQTSGIQQLSEQVQGQVAKGIEDLDNRIGLSERNQISGIQQLSEQVQGQVAKGVEDLDDRIGLSERNQVSGIQQLSEQVQGQVARRIDELQQSLKLLADLTSRGHGEIAGGFGELGSRFDKHSREQQASFQQIRERTTEATRAAKGELAAILEQLRAHLEQLAHDHLAALHKSTQDSQQAAGAAQCELAANFEQIGSRIEKALEARSRNLASSLTEVAEMIQSITTELRSCIAESIARVSSVRSESAGFSETVGERPRVEFVSPAPEIADSLPESSSEVPSDAPVSLEIPVDPARNSDWIEPPVQDGSSPPPDVPDP